MVDEPFLRAPATLDVLKRLAEKQDLVVYCGAGVTRDRTGLGWDDLVREVFEGTRDHQSENDGDIFLLRALEGKAEAKQKASAVVEARGDSSPEDQFLAPVLYRSLYKDHGWSQGNLLRNVAELAIFVAASGSDVSLITTNYDDYLDQEINSAFGDYFETSYRGQKVPGLILEVAGQEAEVVREPRNGAGNILISYIHGRVDSRGVASGNIVFSERSYSLTRQRTTDYLVTRFGSASAFITVGASLNDEPLIEALFRAQELAKTKTKSSVRVALVTVSGDTDADRRAMLTMAELRGRHLGVEILFAQSYAQVAQFVQELCICAMLSNGGQLDSYERSASYPVRLRSWWHHWRGSKWSKRHKRHHRLLRETLNDIVGYFRAEELYDPAEVFRLEVWMRLDPSVQKDNRHLTQFANSTGPLFVEGALRRERIEPHSSVASVRAFTAGKPLLMGLPELGISDEATRWKSFLAVPIYHETLVEVGDFSVVGSTPVAVLTLASTRPKYAAGDVNPAVFAHEGFGLTRYQELLAALEDVGRLLIDV